MKKICILVAFFSVFISNSYASKAGDAMARSDVSHLELLANNLNMFYLIKKDELQGGKESEIVESFVRFSTTKDKKLYIEAFYKAPVLKVTKDQCEATLKNSASKLRDPGSSISQVLPLMTVYSISAAQAQEILNESYMKVYLQAQENTELSIKCNL